MLLKRWVEKELYENSYDTEETERQTDTLCGQLEAAVQR